MFSTKKALLFIANGSEESEVVITLDVSRNRSIKQMTSSFLFLQVLRRAGIKVTVCSIENSRESLQCAQETKILPDISINELTLDEFFDVLIVPGGDEGATTMSKNHAVGTLLRQHFSKGKLIAAICAGRKRRTKRKQTSRISFVGPRVFQEHLIGVNQATVTAYPKCQEDLKKDYRVRETKTKEKDLTMNCDFLSWSINRFIIGKVKRLMEIYKC